MQVWTRALVGALLSVAVLAPTAAAQPTKRDAVCRHKVGQATRTYSTFLVERSLMCHRERIKGKLAPGIDCNDPTTWAANGFSRGVFLHTKDRTRHPRTLNTCRQDAPTLADLGYVGCPAPCDALPASTLPELSACMLCLADDCMLPAIDSVFGTTVLPADRHARKCLERVGRHLQHYFNARAFSQHLCQMKKERGYANWVGVPDCMDVDSATHPFHRFLTSYRNRKNVLIEKRCAGVDVATVLDMCGTDGPSLVSCTNTIADACADSLFSLIFP